MVGISLLTLVPGISGGSETYARELCRALARIGELEYRVFVPTIARDAGDGLPTTVVDGYRASRSMPGRIGAMSLAAVRPGPLRRSLEVDELDALHFPLSVMLPPVRRPPTVTTVLDLQHEEHPEFFGRAELLYRKRVYGWTVRRSRIVVAISEHGRQTLIERYRVAPERVRAIHLAVDHARFFPEAASDGGEAAVARPENRGRLWRPLGGSPRGDYLLYPARPWPHKNHARLYTAYAHVRREHPQLRLVLTGEGDFGAVPDGVEVRGRVATDELVSLYRGAAAVVFPSLYEGFGMPVVEAMACGCPVACSNVTSLPEVVGDAARLFDPRDVDDIAASIDEVLRDPEPFVARGLDRAKLFTWDANARAHDAVYRELASS